MIQLMIKQNPQSVRTYLMLLLFGAFLVFATEELFSKHYPYPFEYDSATYVEMARNFQMGLGFKETASLHSYNEDLITVREWPPGFSIILSALSLTGLSGAEAARLVVKLSLLLLPCTLVFALSPVIGTGYAIGATILSMLSPVLLRFGYIAMTDLPFLLMVSLSLGLLFRCSMPSTPVAGLFWSGIIAGLAYVLRNTGLALFAGVIAAFVIAWIAGVLDWRQALQRGALWALGALAAALPLLVRNFFVLGQVQPYQWPKSQFSFLTNLRQYGGLQLRDFGGFHSLTMLPWDAKLFLVTAIPLTIMLVIALARCWAVWMPVTRFGILTLALYFAAGSAMMVLSATLYRFSDVGLSPRYPIQYTWLLFALVAAPWVHQQQRPSRLGMMIAATVIFALVAGRVAYLNDEVTKARQAAKAYSHLDDLSHNLSAEAREFQQTQPWTLDQQIKRIIASDTSLVEAVHRLPEDGFLVGYPGDVIRLRTARRVRSLQRVMTPEQVWVELVKVRKHVDPERPVYLILYPTSSMLQSADWQQRILTLTPPNFNLVERTSNRMIFEAITR